MGVDGRDERPARGVAGPARARRGKRGLCGAGIVLQRRRGDRAGRWQSLARSVQCALELGDLNDLLR
jgi:hypothetical protein